MPIEQRVVATPPAKIGARIGGGAPAAKPTEPDEPAKPEKPSRRRLLVLVVVAVLLAGGAYVAKSQLLGSDKTAGTAAVHATPKPGAVVKIDPISLNLQGGHYLRLGLALQLTAQTKESPDTSKALDLAISLWSGHTVDEVSDAATRDKLKADLTTKLDTAYDGEVMGVYLTTYVTQ